MYGSVTNGSRACAIEKERRKPGRAGKEIETKKARANSNERRRTSKNRTSENKTSENRTSENRTSENRTSDKERAEETRK